MSTQFINGPAVIALALTLTTAWAGWWITPDYSQTPEPEYKPVHLYWFTVPETPYIYRLEVDTPEGCERVTVLAKSSGYLYVWVDGRRVFAYRVPEKEKPDPTRACEIDLTENLASPGEHVIAVSAPKDGFALVGGFYAGERQIAELGTDRAWRVTKFPPTTIIEDESILQPGYDGPSVPVNLGDEFVADEQKLKEALSSTALKRAKAKVEEAIWRLELLAKKGIYIVDDQEHWWGGANRTAPPVVRSAAGALPDANNLLKNLDSFGYYLAESQAVKLLETVEELTWMAWYTDEMKMLRLASIVIDDKLPDSPEPAPIGMVLPIPDFTSENKRLAKERKRLEEKVKHPLNKLNESRYDRLGWLPLPGLSDDVIGDWGIRVNPVAGPTSLGTPRRWFFKTDPGDSGIEELRWSIGYNIETQWPRIEVPKPWQEVEGFEDYRGIAWYRARIHLPGEWAGNDVLLIYTVADSERVWFNDEEITEFGEWQDRRTYRIPARLVSFGGENCIAIRVEGHGNRSGIVGKVELSCPTLEGDEGKTTPPVDVLSTPLSPCVILTPQTESLQIHHRPGVKLLLPGGNPPGPIDYDWQRDGRLTENWAMLWLTPTTATSTERPVLFVFSSNPVRIEGEDNVTRITFNKPGMRVIAVRPWVKSTPPEEIRRKIDFWRRAALAVPINYASITRLLREGEPIFVFVAKSELRRKRYTDDINYKKVPSGPVLGQTVIYDFFGTQDEWDTEPLRVAPLPALCSFAMETEFRTARNLKIDQEEKLVTLQDGGLLASYRVLVGTNRVSYSYEVEPYARRAGFTSWMFAGSDTGVLGNQREMELIAATGANSYRPQHNFSEDESPHFPGKTRVRHMFDTCNRVGVNYTNNIDQTLGKPREYVRENYAKFIDEVIIHYEAIARQLKDEPFWAVGYDLINEPFDHHHTQYNPAMKRLTDAIRKIDPVHLCYIEPCESWGAIQMLLLVEPTADPLTIYSFHDYNFRLNEPTDRWPTRERDITSICQMWLPAFKFAILHGTGMHCGEFGDFKGATHQILAQKTLLNDFLRLFDQFGMHHHYYSGRTIYGREADGSMMPSNIVRTYRKYFARPDFNRYYRAQLGFCKQ